MKKLIVFFAVVLLFCQVSNAATLSFKGSDKDFLFWNYIEIYQFNKPVHTTYINSGSSINLEQNKDYKIVFHSVFNDLVTKTFTSKPGGIKLKLPGAKYYKISKTGSFFSELKDSESLNLFLVLNKTQPGKPNTVTASIYYENGELKIAILKLDPARVEEYSLIGEQINKLKDIESGKFFNEVAVCTWYFELNNKIKICPVQPCINLIQILEY